nr:RNA-directed DNA polymerase, eukaryota [Tanacetum cinerariifolium]
MAPFRFKEDQITRLSKSIFVTNFPDDTSSQDIWNLCQSYGTVVDVYIPNRRSKGRKRFTFVRFINVDNIERLVGNLCTLWIGRMHLQATVIRIVWADIEGVPMHAWSRNTFRKICSKWGEALDLEESKDDFFACKRICIKTKQEDNILEKFKIIVKGKIYVVRAKEPFVWSPSFTDIIENDYTSDNDAEIDSGVKHYVPVHQVNLGEESENEAISETIFGENADIVAVEKEPTSSSIPVPLGFTLEGGTPVQNAYKIQEDHDQSVEGGSILGIFEEMIKVGQTMGFSMDGWNGKCIVMGDFNEVRRKEDRWGTAFNVFGTRFFNQFISLAGLIEIQLEGYNFTWAHPSASKMSKLDRFLVFDGLLSIFPHLSAMCLDRHLSNHRPILLREVNVDYEATPFRFFYSWIDFLGFDLMVKQKWESITLYDKNKIIRFKKKLQFLKKEIRAWIADHKKRQTSNTHILKLKLYDIDKSLDKGDNASNLMELREEIMNQLQDVQYTSTRVMINGEWVDEPNHVKEEFRNHFAFCFNDPEPRSRFINHVFPNELNADQVFELEKPISKEEIRLAVRGCGENKSPGLDGFTFEFFLDFAKAYDSVQWDYLEDVLISFGFGHKWRSWIRGSLHSSMASILVNGSPSIEFKIHRGLSLNLKKSQLLGVGIHDSTVSLVADMIGCSVLRTPFKYLGIPVGGNMNSIKAWDDIINKIKKRLSNWKLNTLFIGGRLTLLKSVLGSTPLYCDRKISWISWPKVLASRENGGLGVPSFYALNRGLLAKWMWRFRSNENSLWVRFIKAAHGDSTHNIVAACPSPWNTIIKELQILSSMEDRWRWDLNGDGYFHVKDVRSKLDDSLLPKAVTPTRWIKTIPIKLNIFLGMCLEDLDHLLFRCNMAAEVLRAVWMTSSDKKIAITPKPKLPSPSSLFISQNRFIPLSPYSSPYSPRPRSTYLALAHIPSMSQNSTPYNRSPSTASSSSNITRSPSDKPEFQYSVKWWKQIDKGQVDIKAVSEYHNSLIRRTPSISTTRTSITDVDAIERIQAAGSSKEEIQKILNKVRKSPALSEDIFQESQDPYDNEAEFLDF